MANKNDKDGSREVNLEAEKRRVENRKSDPLSDVKDEILNDRSEKGPGTRLFGNLALLGFSFLLFVTGLFVAIMTSITVFGLIVGIIMMVVAVCLPFLARGNWMNKYVSK
jgi:hypothetical protein